MKSDVRGCSTCLPGQEQWENYPVGYLKQIWCQYDYRTPDGELFSTVAKSLTKAREKKRAWLKRRAA